MSLLMKALEKAAKDREETDSDRTAALSSANAEMAAAQVDAELSLEPLHEPSATPAPARQAAAPREPGFPPRKAARGLGDAATTRDAAAAAALVRASQRDEGGGVSAYLRDHPLIVFGSLASLFLIAYGIYVYLQMTNPGVFIKQSVPPNAQIAPPPIRPAVASGSAGPAHQPLSTSLLLPPAGGSGEARSAPIQPSTPAAGSPAAGTTGMARGAAETAVPAGAAADAGPIQQTSPASPSATAAPTASERTPPAAPRDAIRVARGGPAPTLNPALGDAYLALENGNLDASQRLYSQVLQGDPSNVDALLGSASIAAQKNDGEGASRLYMRVLQVDPRNALAQAGLIGMVGRADPLAAETRVKQLIAREPSAYLYFTLGNIYVDQNRWPDAQQAYFQAHHLQPDNPDYAYNLAVGLEHLGQPRLALNFYRRATQLAAAKGRANFSTGAALERISQLERASE